MCKCVLKINFTYVFLLFFNFICGIVLKKSNPIASLLGDPRYASAPFIINGALAVARITNKWATGGCI